ncbi:BRI3-binding protein [Bagarius yarrelli]|uniref:BRI3-binding protein n=1 Tax=Bagarius yarrelli TaxID=175774 RepID=A0A556VWZ8_BAGYA|nr:BRI3-binding protein [Bagarius yarrelli]
MKAVTLALMLCCLLMAEAARSRKEWSGGLRRAASGVYQSLSAVFGEDNIKALYKKFEADPEKAVLPLLVIMGVYFLTGPASAYWRRTGVSTLEDKIDNLETQVRLLNIRLSRVIDSLDRVVDQ